MCQFDPLYVDPEKHLCALIKQEMGVDINEQALRMFIRTQWPRVSKLAHIIHAAGKPATEKKAADNG